jgi:hypothetical protein
MLKDQSIGGGSHSYLISLLYTAKSLAGGRR